MKTKIAEALIGVCESVIAVCARLIDRVRNWEG